MGRKKKRKRSEGNITRCNIFLCIVIKHLLTYVGDNSRPAPQREASPALGTSTHRRRSTASVINPLNISQLPPARVSCWFSSVAKRNKLWQKTLACRITEVLGEHELPNEGDLPYLWQQHPNEIMNAINQIGYAHKKAIHSEDTIKGIQALFKKLFNLVPGEHIHFVEAISAMRRTLYLTKEQFMAYAEKTWADKQGKRKPPFEGYIPYNVLRVVVWRWEVTEIELGFVVQAMRDIAASLGSSRVGTTYEALRSSASEYMQQFHGDNTQDGIPVVTNVSGDDGSTVIVSHPRLDVLQVADEKVVWAHLHRIYGLIERTGTVHPHTRAGFEEKVDEQNITTFSDAPGDTCFFSSITLHAAPKYVKTTPPRNRLVSFAFFKHQHYPDNTDSEEPVTVHDYVKKYKKALSTR